MDNSDFMLAARDVIAHESRAVRALSARIDEQFAAAVELVVAAPGRVLLTGLGKSGHVARKIAATLASLGTPAHFLHATEALHGDAGVICPGDVVVALSNSGETAEVIEVARLAVQRGAPVVAVTGCGGSSRLAALGRSRLDVAVDREADHLDLAPTSSTTATMAMGDALAVAVAVRRGFDAADFARHHPGGSLGNRLAGVGSSR